MLYKRHNTSVTDENTIVCCLLHTTFINSSLYWMCLSYLTSAKYIWHRTVTTNLTVGVLFNSIHYEGRLWNNSSYNYTESNNDTCK